MIQVPYDPQIPANLFTMHMHGALIPGPLNFILDPTGKMVVALDFIRQE